MVILITGGTRSGKSSYGEKILQGEDQILYLATATITDEEMQRRVDHHKKRRGLQYQTIEGYAHIDEALKNTSCNHAMLDCVGTTITNIMFEQLEDPEDISQDAVEHLEQYILNYFQRIIDTMKVKSGKQVIISNEVGMSLVSEYPLGRIFTDILGRVNQYIANQADEVVLMVSGIPVKIRQKT